MKLSLLFSAVLAVTAIGSQAARAESFSYSGSLQDSGKAAKGSYDFQLVLYADAAGTKAISAPIVLRKVAVHEGTFSTSIDFGFSLETMYSAYLGEQVRRSESNIGLSKPSSDATIALSAYAGSDLIFDGNSVLLDFDSVIDATIHCNFHDGNGKCTQQSCKKDIISDCSNFYEFCMDQGGWFDGTADEATCDNISI